MPDRPVCFERYVDLSLKENTGDIWILNIIKTYFVFVIYKIDKNLRYFNLKLGEGLCTTQWHSLLMHRATSRKFAVSIPDGAIGNNPSGRTMVLG